MTAKRDRNCSTRPAPRFAKIGLYQQLTRIIVPVRSASGAFGVRAPIFAFSQPHGRADEVRGRPADLAVSFDEHRVAE